MILAIIQARYSSSRLPGKVLKPILGEPMLWRMIERAQRSRLIAKLVVATSTGEDDTPIEQLCREKGVSCFRGSLDDVLDRFYRAASEYAPTDVVRLTGDCPLIDPAVVDRVIAEHIESGADYTSNTTLDPSYPDGLDTEVVRFGVLEEAWREAKLPSQREHVLPFVHCDGARYRLHNVVKPGESMAYRRWTVDEPEDFELVTRVFEALYPVNKIFSFEDVAAFLDRNPELERLNQGFDRNEGYEKSLAQDRAATGAQTEKTHAPAMPRSLEIQKRARERIPGMTQLLSKRPDMFSLGVWPGYYSRARGARIWDLDGNGYLDMSISGIGANILGYADDDVDAAVIEAVKNGSSSSLNCPEEVELADLLCDLHPWAHSVRYTRSGGEAMTVAVRIARAHTKRDRVAFCGYHGWHDWYLAANVGTENALGEHLIAGLDPRGVPKALAGTAFPFRHNRLEELEAIVAKNKGELAAVVLEPLRNSPPDPAFVDGVRALANEAGAVLVIDEISSGFRMNTGGAHLIYGYVPDMAVFSKSLGNGYPIAAIIGTESVMASAQSTFISSTCWTERVGPAAAIATLSKHRLFDVGSHLVALGRSVQEGWAKLLAKHEIAASISGMYPMSHFDIEGPDALKAKALYIQEMLDRGFLASNLYYAMYAHTPTNVRDYLQAADEAFGTVARALREKRLDAALRGDPARAGFHRLN